MIVRKAALGLLTIALGAFGLAAPASAAGAPSWKIELEHNQTNFPAGASGEYWVALANVGDAPTSEPVTLTLELPPAMSRASVRTSFDYVYQPGLDWSCPGEVGDATIICTTTGVVRRHSINRELIFGVDVDLPPGTEEDLVATARVEGGGAAPAVAAERTRISPIDSGFGFVPDSFVPDFFEADERTPEREAGAHPDLLTIPFDINSIAAPVPDNPFQKLASGSVRDMEVDMPPGFVGNPTAVAECSHADFTFGACPPASQVGRLDVRIYPLLPPSPTQSFTNFTAGVFNLDHPRGTISDLAAQFLGNPFYLKVSLDPANNYAIRTSIPSINETRPLFSQKLTLWGVPADSSHDWERCPRFTMDTLAGGNTDSACSANARPLPFLTLPSQCETDSVARLHHYDSWQHRGVYGPEIDYTLPGRMTHCDRPRFEPDVEIVATGKQANTPTGLDVHVKIAQNENPNALATPPVKRFTVRLPEGMTFSPSFADGLKSCTLAQMQLGTNNPVECPDASRIGEAALHTPLLPRSAEGSMYLAAQGDNPFGSTFALLLVLHDTEERGALIKIPGRIDVDPATGQIVTVFNDMPQFPFDDLTLKFRSGPRAPLVSSPSCGKQRIGIEVASYAQPEAPVDTSNTYEVTEGSDGTPCPPDSAQRRFSPRFSAGTVNPVAGAYSPFLFRLSRDDSEQELSQVTTTLPRGLVARIAGVPFCPEQAIASISSRLGAGRGELNNPACPAASRIGTVSTGLGAGPGPNYFDGEVYFAGPYKGAPLSLALVVPGLVGPFDLGNIVVRAALHVDPDTAQVRVVSDSFPTIRHGVILRVRDVRFRVDRPDTTINPTSCAQKSVGGQITGVGGDLLSTADDSLFSTTSHFQVGSCSDLRYKPKLSLRLFGGTHRGSHPRLRATVDFPPGGANTAAASVALPRSEFLDQGHIGTVCTRVQFAQDACPAASVYGTVSARTPLLDEALTGRIYLRSSDHLLPDLVVAMRDERIEANLVGRIDSVDGRIRITFDSVPDAPVSRVAFNLAGGKKGLLQNGRSVCDRPPRAIARFTGQNRATVTLHPVLRSACTKAKKKRTRSAGQR